MRVIKHYSNRKLYDTEAKKYVTLEEIGTLVRGGEDVKVVDNDSGEDLTTVTLSQILLDKEKKHKHSLPKSFFTSVIQSGTRIKEALVERADKLLGPQLENALKHLRIPSRTEFERLRESVAALEIKLAALEGKRKTRKKGAE